MKLFIIAVLVAMLHWLPFCNVMAQGVISLPQTGQTRCWDVPGNEIACAGTGQDGDLQAGVQWPNPRFTVNGECVTDNLTGLMWTKNANMLGGNRSWQQALDYANDLVLCGYSDWRLPNINELESLGHAGVPEPAVWLGTQGFANIQTDYYWSSTTSVSFPSSAWYLRLTRDGTYIGDNFKGNTDVFGGKIWPVRGESSQLSGSAAIWKTGQMKCYNADGVEIACPGTGQDGDLQTGVQWPNPRFTVNGECVTDNLTGLMWTKNGEMPSPPECSLGSKYIDWQEALDYVKCLNIHDYLGYSDWRLPNRKELMSLLDRSRLGSALPPDNPFEGVQGYYASSTTTTFSPSEVWLVGMEADDLVYPGSKLFSSGVWPVRAGGSTGDIPLSVIKTGSGTGTVRSSPQGIDCGDVCSAPFRHGSSVTLTADPVAGSTFAGWSGGCSGTGTCVVTMDGAKNVTAAFSDKHRLTTYKTGSGRITSSPTGINCGSTCASEFAPGTTVTLTAVPDTGFSFVGWSGGGCAGPGSCAITMNEDTVVTATFMSTCAYFTVGPESKLFPAKGFNMSLTTNVSISTAELMSCPAPEVSVAATWVTASLKTWNKNKGSVKISVTPTTQSTVRTAVVFIGGAPFTIYQTGAPCALGLTPTAATFDGRGGSQSFAVVTNPGDCPWTATTNQDWIALDTYTGVGYGYVTFDVLPYSGSWLPRTGSITVRPPSGSYAVQKAFSVKQTK